MAKGFLDDLMGDLFGDVRKLTKDASSEVRSTTLKHVYRVVTDDKGLTLEVELPGCDRNDVTLHAGVNVIKVAATMPGGKGITGTYAIARDFDPKSSRARMANGLLEIRMSKVTVPTDELVPITIAAK